ncbi:MAG: hypothetical protein ACK5L3_02760 [Oscillospiraceae bacterium]
MVDMINEAVKTAAGNIVCIEKSMKINYDLDHKCRLIDLDEYSIVGYERLYGFVAGIFAGNYDIEELYIDGILKVGNENNKDLEGLGEVLADFDKLAADKIKVVVTVSAELDALPPSVKKYL